MANKKRENMIDKIMFETPVTISGKKAHGMLLYTPDTDDSVTRIIGIDKNTHDFKESEGFIDIPNSGLEKLRKIITKIIKGDYDKKELEEDNSLLVDND